MKTLDWQHVALLIAGMAFAAGAVWFGTRAANAQVIGIGVTVGGLLLTQITSIFKTSPSQTTTATVTVTEPKPADTTPAPPPETPS